MLMKPSIITLPDYSFPVNNTVGCTSGTYYAPDGRGGRCTRGFSCQPYSYNANSCVDCTYNTCSYTLGVGVVGVGATVGIAIT